MEKTYWLPSLGRTLGGGALKKAKKPERLEYGKRRGNGRTDREGQKGNRFSGRGTAQIRERIKGTRRKIEHEFPMGN